jgi:hypothetical protein
MRAVIIAIFLTSSLSLLSCDANEKLDMNTLHNEVLSILENYQSAHEKKDINLLRECFSNDPDIIILGTDEKELWVDRESLLAEQDRFYNSVDEVKLSVRDKVVRLCGSGKSAWFYMRVNWIVNSGDDKYNLNNIRTTGVMNKVNDQWGIVMMHTSLPVAGQAVKY